MSFTCTCINTLSYYMYVHTNTPKPALWNTSSLALGVPLIKGTFV